MNKRKPKKAKKAKSQATKEQVHVIGKIPIDGGKAIVVAVPEKHWYTKLANLLDL